MDTYESQLDIPEKLGQGIHGDTSHYDDTSHYVVSSTQKGCFELGPMLQTEVVLESFCNLET